MTSAEEDREFITEMISSTLLEDAMAWIGMNLNPGDVFGDDDLKEWAESNGYVVEE